MQPDRNRSRTHQLPETAAYLASLPLPERPEDYPNVEKPKGTFMGRLVRALSGIDDEGADRDAR